MRIKSIKFKTTTEFVSSKSVHPMALKIFSLDLANQIKSSLYSLNTLSGVTSERCLFSRLCAIDHASRLQWWRVVGNVLEIWSARDLNPIRYVNVYQLLTIDVTIPYHHLIIEAAWQIVLKNLILNIRRFSITNL